MLATAMILIILLLILIARKVDYIRAALITESYFDTRKFKYEDIGLDILSPAAIQSFDGEDISFSRDGIERKLNFHGVLSLTNTKYESNTRSYQIHLSITLKRGLINQSSALGFLKPWTKHIKDSLGLSLDVEVDSCGYDFFRNIGNALIENNVKDNKKEFMISICGIPGKDKMGEKFLITSLEIEGKHQKLEPKDLLREPELTSD
jgi:hypothetical protein